MEDFCKKSLKIYMNLKDIKIKYHSKNLKKNSFEVELGT